MEDTHRELVSRIMALPILQAEWVLWFLFALSVLSLAIIVERAYFLVHRRVDTHKLRGRLSGLITRESIDSAVKLLKHEDSMETNVLARALSAAPRGPEAVEELVRAALLVPHVVEERAELRLGKLGGDVGDDL